MCHGEIHGTTQECSLSASKMVLNAFEPLIPCNLRLSRGNLSNVARKVDILNVTTADS